MRSLELIDGIGTELANKLREHGVASVEELVAIRPVYAKMLASSINGISWKGLSHRFRPQAKFLIMENVTPEIAKALVEQGIRSYRDLVNTYADQLLGRLSEPVAGLSTEIEILRLQVASAKAASEDNVIIKALDLTTGKPIANATVFTRDGSHLASTATDAVKSDANGDIFIRGCAQGRSHTFMLTAPGYKRSVKTLLAKGGVVHKVILGMSKGNDAACADEFKGESIGVIPAGVFTTNELVAKDEIPGVSLWLIHAIAKSGVVTLFSLARRRFDMEIRTYSLKIDKSDLPATAVEGETYIYSATDGWRRASDSELLQYKSNRWVISGGKS
jgi:hypothetical protein